MKVKWWGGGGGGGAGGLKPIAFENINCYLLILKWVAMATNKWYIYTLNLKTNMLRMLQGAFSAKIFSVDFKILRHAWHAMRSDQRCVMNESQEIEYCFLTGDSVTQS